eukprot:2968886-Rhodomonas_salina.2
MGKEMDFWTKDKDLQVPHRTLRLCWRCTISILSSIAYARHHPCSVLTYQSASAPCDAPTAEHVMRRAVVRLLALRPMRREASDQSWGGAGKGSERAREGGSERGRDGWSEGAREGGSGDVGLWGAVAEAGGGGAKDSRGDRRSRLPAP